MRWGLAILFGILGAIILGGLTLLAIISATNGMRAILGVDNYIGLSSAVKVAVIAVVTFFTVGGGIGGAIIGYRLTSKF